MQPRSPHDLRESVDFYVELLGAQPIPAPNFGIPVQWLALGRTQLHLFERELKPTSHHHCAATVEDREPVYRAAARRGAFDGEAFGNRLVALPGDVVQLYVRDPRPTDPGACPRQVGPSRRAVAGQADHRRSQVDGGRRSAASAAERVA